MIHYQNILNKNLLNVFIEILKEIEKNGLSGNNHLYITFSSKNSDVSIPKWLLEKYPSEMTIVVQNEYYHLSVKKNYFAIGLSFNNIKTDLKIPFTSIISFVDPSAKFGLNYQVNESVNIDQNKIAKKINKTQTRKVKNKNSSNVIIFSKYKKN